MLNAAQLQSVRARAIDYLKETREPHALLFMNIIHRRFGVAEFADTLARFDDCVPEHPDRAPVLRVLRRIADADNPIVNEDWEKITVPTDRLLVSALYCDRIGLPESYGAILEKATLEGGYAATHALLSWNWVQENRCELALPEGYPERMYTTVADIINADPTSINDLKLEAAAFLCLALQASRVDLQFVQRVVGIQNADGGWGDVEASNWHSTILGLLLVLHINLQ